MVYIHCALPSDQIAVLNHALQDCESDFTFFLVSVFSFFVLSADILTMSTPWMTGAQPSVGCKCRSYNSWSCRYCPTECFEPNIYVSSSADTSSVSVQTPPCLTDISHGVTHRGMGVVVLVVVVVVQQIK